MRYYGTVSGKVRSIPQPGVDYEAEQTIELLICQGPNILATCVISKIDSESGVRFNIDYQYSNLYDPLVLIFKTAVNNDQFNRDHPVEVVELEFDQLFNIPHVTQSGNLVSNGATVSTGNVIFCSGELHYEIKLPIAARALTS